MPIDSKHPEYTKNLIKWQRCRDCVDGEDAIKAQKYVYLPQLSGQEDYEYQAYLQRATFYAATKRTVKGLAGAVMRKQAILEFPIPPLLQSIGPQGETIGQVIDQVVEEVLTTGRVGLMVDSDADETDPTAPPYITLYYPENIINWAEAVIQGRRQLVMLVLHEDSPIREASDEGEDPFEWKTDVDRYRVLTLEDYDTPAPYLRVQVWEKKENAPEQGNDDAEDQAELSWELLSDIEPKFIGGRPIPYIPFVIINPGELGVNIETSPVLDLVNVNLAHYRNAADYEHGLHFTALPTPWAAGFETEDSELRIGSAAAWVTNNPEAKVGMLEFSGAGLSAIAAAMEEKKKQMSILGARLLEDTPTDPEATATVALRHSGEDSILSKLVHSTEEGITKCLQWVADWIGEDGQTPGQVSVQLNEEFTPETVDSQTLQQLMFAVQGGQMSWDTWFYNLQRGNYIPDGRTADEEKALIEVGGPQTPQQQQQSEAANQSMQINDQRGNDNA